MKKFFLSSRIARAYMAAISACLFAGIILPAIDWRAAVEAGWSTVAWCTWFMTASAVSLYGLSIEYKQYQMKENQSIC
jgi:hypothetical protein